MLPMYWLISRTLYNTLLVLSHIDYVNVILAGCSNVVLKKLQRVQNMAAKLVLSKGKYESATKARMDLHWLPIKV